MRRARRGASNRGVGGPQRQRGVQDEVVGPVALAPHADWLLSIAQSRAFAIARNGKVVVGGKVKIKGSRLTFHEVVGPIACKGAQATGVYSFSLSGKTLKLKRVRDSCQGRILVLTSRAFTKVR
jgi:hypothetical protein